MTTTEIRPFHIDIPQAEIDDLHRRLAETRWASQLPGDGRSRGVPVAEVRELAEYWRTAFDWRAREARLNEFPQYLTEIDGLDVHFVHVRSAEPGAAPLVLNHGWPNSFVEFTELIGRLTDPRAYGGDPARAFHVVVPSVPGYAFSAPPRETGWSVERVARMWVELMTRLGYERFGVQGGDLGSYVATAMAEAAPDRVTGLYITGGLGFPTQDDLPELTEEERANFTALMSADWANGVDHHALLRSAPQTFAYGWTDSPVAALSWMLQKFHDFSAAGALAEAIDRDALLTNISLYWFTETFATSAWSYYDSTGFGWPTGSPTVPTGVYSGDAPSIRRLAERTAKIVHWPTGNPAGHHFIAMDQPDAYAADLRAFFAAVE
ncbi:pimeloyl-ACP methyl ester carboxylesterase [Nocardia transvalensis]|uniref:Pimeloyl-ACP methyl ester carboxylesterase n=1 Tax=Nocardia transvalensis TaxID=37333 RepID=A0A7W9PD05_9NOCA|nr:epoxide hydrolase [Nocardia transvalensis]MBB5913872.1 pimeloyl-ACP methyl ester carboxylesterase [Nocardia transvalensis]